MSPEGSKIICWLIMLCILVWSLALGIVANNSMLNSSDNARTIKDNLEMEWKKNERRRLD